MGRSIGHLTTIALVGLALLMSSSPGASAAQAVLAWDASPNPSVIGYKVYCGTQSRVYQTPIDAGNTTDYTVTGLSAMQAAYFTVTAYSSTQESSFSREVACDFITAQTTSNGQIAPAGTSTLAVGESQTYSIVPNSGYQIGSVSVDGTQVANPATTYTFSNVSCCHTIAATFVPVVPASYSISAGSGAGGSISPAGSVSVATGANQTFTISPAANYQIASVTVDGVSQGAISKYTFNSVAATHTIVAAFTPIRTYIISASVTMGSGAKDGQTGGSISPSGAVSVTGGANQAFLISPAANYTISDVQVDGSSVGPVMSYTFSDLTANHTISALFTVATYTITASAGPNGSISPSGDALVTSGSGRSFEITPSSGYAVCNVVVDGASIGAVTSYTFSDVATTHTIAVTFVPAIAPEFDAVGLDSANIFIDNVLAGIVYHERSSGTNLEDDSNFIGYSSGTIFNPTMTINGISYTGGAVETGVSGLLPFGKLPASCGSALPCQPAEFFTVSNTNAQTVTDPCFTFNENAVGSTCHFPYRSVRPLGNQATIYRWRIVLQKKPASDIVVKIEDCVLTETPGCATGIFSTPGETGFSNVGPYLLFWQPMLPTITAVAIPGPNASLGFNCIQQLYARTQPNYTCSLSPLCDMPFVSKALFDEEIMVAMPQTTSSPFPVGNFAPGYTLTGGDMIDISIGIPENTPNDYYFGSDNVLLEYIGMSGTEVHAGTQCP
ncbi:MAG: fibronectin type III domain-containing protein [Syntrophobacteraceae bacterium]|nr:fibronectin type III domain-containing protein [Syntrophobacteraceae bacterium]